MVPCSCYGDQDRDESAVAGPGTAAFAAAAVVPVASIVRGTAESTAESSSVRSSALSTYSVSNRAQILRKIGTLKNRMPIVPNHHRDSAFSLSKAPLVPSSMTASHSASNWQSHCHSTMMSIRGYSSVERVGGTASVPVPFRGSTSPFQGHRRLSIPMMTNPTISAIDSDDDNNAAISSFVSRGICRPLISRLLFVDFSNFCSFPLNSDEAAASDYSGSLTIAVLLHFAASFLSHFLVLLICFGVERFPVSVTARLQNSSMPPSTMFSSITCCSNHCTFLLLKRVTLCL